MLILTTRHVFLGNNCCLFSMYIADHTTQTKVDFLRVLIASIGTFTENSNNYENPRVKFELNCVWLWLWLKFSILKTATAVLLVIVENFCSFFVQKPSKWDFSQNVAQTLLVLFNSHILYKLVLIASIHLNSSNILLLTFLKLALPFTTPKRRLLCIWLPNGFQMTWKLLNVF